MPVLIAGRDEESRRWLGPGAADPRPTACVVVDGGVVGWVDYDEDREWLAPGEVNVGYQLFPPHRGRGYATRALQLLLHHLATSTDQRTASALIDRGNAASLAVARRAGFVARREMNASLELVRPVPPLRYSDGVVTIRRQELADLDADLASKDDEQIDWLWLPGQRESWEAMTPDEQRAHAARGLLSTRDAFGRGPKWAFSVDTAGVRYVAYVDGDLANSNVPRGEANISYSSHPLHRGRGHVSRAVRLVVGFLRDHTGAREAHVIVDARNEASLRVARAVGARETERWTDDRGRTMVRHVIDVRRPSRSATVT
ncbi:MAG TPA: GNAT family N-acetyltransferase [Acidimicrobiales bacterium]|nr:GNAT family N-acetyltransferase [Acidimicrobiales bacterium]